MRGRERLRAHGERDQAEEPTDDGGGGAGWRIRERETATREGAREREQRTGGGGEGGRRSGGEREGSGCWWSPELGIGDWGLGVSVQKICTWIYPSTN